MKATSLLFGDLADLLQDGAIEDAHIAAESAQSRAHYIGRQVAVLRQRVIELERDNALLAVVLLQVLKQLEAKGRMSRADLTKSLRDELGRLREQNCDDFLNVFRDELGLPRQQRTNLAVHKPLPPERPGATRTMAETAAKPPRESKP
jgi:hypothetical protein